MTTGEILMAQSFFKKSIDYSAVDVQPTSWDSPHVFGNTVYMPSWMGGDKHDQSTPGKVGDFRGKFLHEMEHVRQNQKGEFVTLKAGFAHAVGGVKGFFKALFTAAFSKKTFGQIMRETREEFVYGFSNEPVKPHSEYSVEQRGQIVEEHANAQFKGGKGPLSADEQKAQQIISSDPGALER